MRRAGAAGVAAVARQLALRPCNTPQPLLLRVPTCAAAAAGVRSASQLARGESLLPLIARQATEAAARSRGNARAWAVAATAAAAAAATARSAAACDAAASSATPAALLAASAAQQAKEAPCNAGADAQQHGDPDPPHAIAPVPRAATGMAELFALAREHWRPLLVVALLTLASTALKLLVTRRMGALYDLAKRAGAGAAGMAQLRPLAEVLGLRLAEGVFKALQAWAWARAAARVEQRLVSRAFAALLGTDMAALDLTHTGALAGHVAQDAAEVTRALETLAFKGVRNVTSVVVGATALASVSSEISLLALSMVPPATLLFLAVGHWGARLAKAAVKKAQAASAFAAERLGAVGTVRGFAQEAAECRRYGAAVGAARDARDAHAAVHALHVGLLTSLPGMGMGIFLYAGSELVARGTLSVGALTTIIPLVLEVAGALGGLSRLHASLVHGADAALRLRALDAAPRVIEGAGSTALPAVRGAVAFEHVRFAYPVRPDVNVLDGFSLQLRPGEVFALVGASGSGKSTVAALLTRMYDVKAGRITLDGVDIRTLDPRRLRQAIGKVTQEPILFSGSVADNIQYARPDAPAEAVVAAAKAANAHGFIAAMPLGYNTPVGERGAQLSGGQRQRIAIARVLLAAPKLLLLDEATSALDAESEMAVSDALQTALRGRTCIIIAHRLSTVRRADRIGVMSGGRLVEVGTHDELMAARGAYWRLVQSSSFLDDDGSGGKA